VDQTKRNEDRVAMLRVDDGCPDVDTCPGFGTHVDDPEGLYVIVTEVTDTQILSDFAGRVGPGERLGRIPRRLAPEVFDS
jgi:hypothetical protein